MSHFCDLYTDEGHALNGVPWHVYPRPQLRRESFICLNGEWNFSVCSPDQEPQFERIIRVPFAPESILSGIHEVFPEDHVLWYRRDFVCPKKTNTDRVLLHFGAVDQHVQIYVNGISVGEHSGGYESFSVDITDALLEDNTLTVRVTDHLSDGVMPYGKQRRDRGGMWYTPVSGIWQTVWMEVVPAAYVRSLRVETTVDTAVIYAEEVESGTVRLMTPDGLLTVPMADGQAFVSLERPRLWSPEDPYLYNFTLETETDRIQSYFALRILDIREIHGIPRLCLNGKPYFFHGLLDQGYWSDGLFTPASPELYEKEILSLKELGFNTLRKHIKVEPELFYYACDRLGMIVWQDMVNNGNYSFLRDTALPTVGLQHLHDRYLHRNPRIRQQFLAGMKTTVHQLYNHPSICLWTIFNEGWGQFCSTDMYRLLREMDRTRFIDTASGWFSGGETDVDSRHVYFRRVKMKPKKKPLILSEFGGYTFSVDGHVFNPEKTYGYGKFTTRPQFAEGVCRLYREEILPLISTGLCAAIYTQVSDVEDEINGIFTFDRKVQKLLPEELAPLSAQMCNAISQGN